MKNKDCENLLQTINQHYLYSNPLHPDIYPELIKMESEIIKMVGHLFELPESGGGNLTTGGTESTICALKAYKKHKKRYFNLFRPEVLCTKTVHAAVNKACDLLDLKIVYVDLDENNVMVLSKNSLVYERLESLGISVQQVPFRHRMFWDGGLHCITNGAWAWW